MAMIPLFVDKGKAYVWNSDDWYTIRSEHRICGALIGSMPSFPRQNDFLGLPMELMSEEACLLVEKGICELFKLPNLTRTPSYNVKKTVEALEEKVLKEQTETLRKRKIEQLSQKIDLIMAGKRKKLLAKGLSDAELDKDTLLQDEIKKLNNLAPAHALVHLPSESNLPGDRVQVDADILVPNVLEGEGAIKYSIFKDLWEKQYYITSGSKFGSDYLVYPGDPVKFHASYMVRCVNHEICFNSTNYVAFGRLSVAVNKLAVFAYCINNKVEYQTLQWHDSIN